jgi:hypothetical protein
VSPVGVQLEKRGGGGGVWISVTALMVGGFLFIYLKILHSSI